MTLLTVQAAILTQATNWKRNPLPGSQMVAGNQEQKCAIIPARKESRPGGKFWYKFITLG